MKRAVAIVLILIMMFSLCACGKPSVKSEDEVIQDLLDYQDYDETKEAVFDISLEIIDRKTDMDNGTDMLNVVLSFEGPNSIRHDPCEVTYHLYEQGWKIDDVVYNMDDIDFEYLEIKNTPDEDAVDRAISQYNEYFRPAITDYEIVDESIENAACYVDIRAINILGGNYLSAEIERDISFLFKLDEMDQWVLYSDFDLDYGTISHVDLEFDKSFTRDTSDGAYKAEFDSFYWNANEGNCQQNEVGEVVCITDEIKAECRTFSIDEAVYNEDAGQIELWGYCNQEYCNQSTGNSYDKRDDAIWWLEIVCNSDGNIQANLYITMYPNWYSVHSVDVYWGYVD